MNVTVVPQFYYKIVFPIHWQRTKFSHTVPEPVTGFIGLWAGQKHRLPLEKHLRITVWRFDVYIRFWPLLSLWLWHLWPLLTAGCAIIRDGTSYDKCLILLKIKLKFLRIVSRFNFLGSFFRQNETEVGFLTLFCKRKNVHEDLAREQLFPSFSLFLRSCSELVYYISLHQNSKAI